MRPNCYAVVAASLAAAASAGSLKDIKHIVLFMQENRAFDHYFGTMAGVRNFADPNVQINPDGHSTFEQLVSPSQSNASTILKPWYINYLGGEWVNATQCIAAGDNSWQAMHGAYNGGLVNKWVEANTPYNWGHFKRAEVPTHFDIAEGWTVLDMSTESILAATDPNRIHWMSGSVNVPGTPSNPDGEGGMILDNNATPGCEAPHFNCYPFTWKTFPEYLQEAGVSWQVYQDFDNFEDNMLAYFEQYQNAPNGSALMEKGNSYPGLAKFYEDAKKGTLPQVSYIIGPAELSEHYPYLPSDGAWLQKQVVDAVMNGPAYKETALFITYDEVGGWGDHVVPIVPPNGTAGEWIDDPYGQFGWVPVGPGYRIPSYVISPWTRGGKVFVEHADHSSHIMFVEQWAAANGFKGVHSEELTQWRRNHMSNLVNVFDFDHPDYSLPHITDAPAPLTEPQDPSEYSGNFSLGSLSGNYIGAAKCLSDYPDTQPPVPYGPANANQNLALLVEEGFKQVRGSLTEGRYLTFEMLGMALTNVGGGFVSVSFATPQHDNIHQRWILHAQGSENTNTNTFTIQSAVDQQYISKSLLGRLVSKPADAQPFTIVYNPNGATYSLQLGSGGSGRHVSLQQSGGGSKRNGPGSIQWGDATLGSFEIFSVSYHH